MKYIFSLILCFYFTNALSQISEFQKSERFIRIWGVLKYHHPKISDGKYDFNEVFLKEYHKLQTIETSEAFDNEMLDWIGGFGIDQLESKKKQVSDQLFTANYRDEWINESTFSPELTDLLHQLTTNSNYQNHYAKANKLSSSVDFSNDLPLKNFDASLEAHRLLFLASFWNAMNYWNVNSYLTETPWDKVITDLIPEFKQSGETNFQQAKEHLFSLLNDSHSDYSTSYTLNSISNFPNFGGRIINDSLVITSVYRQEFFDIDSLAKGDVIYGVNDTTLHQYYTTKFSKVISASNQNYLRSAIEKTYLLASNEDSILVNVLKKDGRNLKQYIQLNPLEYPAERYSRMWPPETEAWKEVNSEIGYINLNNIDKSQLEDAFLHFENFKGIIIDLRNYPRNIDANDIAKYLYPEKRIFMKALTSVEPSYGEFISSTALGFISNPFEAGKRNKSYFKGKVILLVDRVTASKAEWIGMAIQATRICTTVGEQTFGAVMNRNPIPLLDGSSIDFTGVGAFYPSGEGVQRNGLKLDVEIKESAIGYNKDLYVDTAIKLIYEEED
ncbi:MAG: S41 family peptidase [Algoriphagus sp.]|uniref:S41 family peptidase n=1 Tax=Algoriphagus sp. TaxID=1872435 RepID=UPI00262BEEE1|nr:S41 family peptidase [Algoriphagus sp.]MDG1278440.1 S41 family peptidase [Algoriphagus sp.]